MLENWTNEKLEHGSMETLRKMATMEIENGKVENVGNIENWFVWKNG